MNNRLFNHDIFQQNSKLDRIIILVLLSIFIIVPLIVRLHIMDFASPLISRSILNSGTKGDFYSYYKFLYLMGATCLISFLFVFRMAFWSYPVKESYINIPVAILFVIIGLSAALAPYKTLALFGEYNRLDGTLTYIACLTLFFIAANLKYSNQYIYAFIYALYPFTILNGIIGIVTFYGMDLLQIDFIHALIFPADLGDVKITEGSSFQSTINHPNYISGISAVLIMTFLTLAMFEPKRIRAFIHFCMAVISTMLLFTSMSTSGFLTIVVLFPLLMLVLYFQKKKRQGILAVGSFLICLVVLLVTMSSHNYRVWDNSVGFFVSTNPFNGDSISLATIAYAETADEQEQGKKVDIPPLPILPESGAAPGTGRLYIWEKTVELIKERPFLGYGIDTLAYHFPQNDVGIISGLESSDIVVDKPHNLYIGLAFGSGMIALLAFLALLVMHLWKYCKVLWRVQLQDQSSILLMTLFMGWMAYIIQALFNDSIIGTSPIFFILFGVGVSYIQQYIEKSNQVDEDYESLFTTAETNENDQCHA
ncbi:O-antigen ligase family protein [Schinkia azotoformans]|uniref:O-antigen ligase family protein n=1 Tax=Schinkia azotoformans TaxID=1454 RepID=UPI002E1B03CE|nr:O-antigen ligase family protein [Schinkia azotoformans]